MTNIRPAREADLRAMYEVYYQNDVRDSPTPPPMGDTPAYLRHIFQTGMMYVAEHDTEVLAFAGVITRGNITYLTDLFVRPLQQSHTLGKTLLRAILSQNSVRCTESSSDPRALALYIREGMQPQWPYFALRLHKSMYKPALHAGVEVVEADASDPELLRWDASVSGRLRLEDQQFWLQQQRAIPLWFWKQKQVLGYGYVRVGAGTLWYPDACILGPIGVSNPEDATDCVIAAVNYAIQRADVLRIDVPGPHPCLATLLQRGFLIVSLDTFMSSAPSPFFDAHCYIPSGGDLL